MNKKSSRRPRFDDEEDYGHGRTNSRQDHLREKRRINALRSCRVEDLMDPEDLEDDEPIIDID